MRGCKATPNKSLKLLNNARGQLDAVIRLIHDDAAHVDILKQILATISLLRRSHTEILKKYLEECLDEDNPNGNGENRAIALAEIMKYMEKNF